MHNPVLKIKVWNVLTYTPPCPETFPILGLESSSLQTAHRSISSNLILNSWLLLSHEVASSHPDSWGLSYNFQTPFHGRCVHSFMGLMRLIGRRYLCCTLLPYSIWVSDRLLPKTQLSFCPFFSVNFLFFSEMIVWIPNFIWVNSGQQLAV